MPGILPMKVIKVGTSAQSRIAQACDRCRSKKIRCDGIRPCCSQCANVGFECKTSDKLSRRAFPRGYTESLEERVRILESEVRELKDLLDEKDEKIDILSKMHTNSKPPAISSPIKESARENKDDTFRVQASPLLFESENSDSYFMGASSGRAFVDAFKRKIQESGKSCTGFNTDGFLNLHDKTPKNTTLADASLAPPRLFTDRMVNIFFQEWAPLFPILHKPTFLRLYEEFLENPEQMTKKHKLAQLYLVFGIAGLSVEVPDREQLDICEVRWKAALDALLMDNTVMTLQCLILAQLFCISRGDYKRLQHYKAIAVGLSHRLGLHQSQKRFSFGALTIETRKKVFWSLYTVDCFSAALLGLPKLLTETDVYAEYPTDIDDEYVTEKGFQPTLPGEYTKISSALALFKVSRILSKVLEKNYPAAASHDLSLSSIGALEAELKEWSANLPNHLKLTFIQDKPSTDVTGNRSPLLSLTFYYIQTLIHRPVIGSCLSKKSSSSAMALAESSKHIIQITQLLKERHLAFSICLNKDEVMTLCGLSLLYQRLDLKQDGKLMRDGQELVQEVIKSLTRSKANGASDFAKLASSMGIKDAVNYGEEGESRVPSPPAALEYAPAVINHGRSASDVMHTQHQRRPTVATVSMSQMDNVSLLELSNCGIDSSFSDHSGPALGNQYQQVTLQVPSSRKTPSKSNRGKAKKPNLDYLSLSSRSSTQPSSPIFSRGSFSDHNKNHNSTTDFRAPNTANATSQSQQGHSPILSSSWENILGSVDEAQIYDAMYGGTTLPLSLTTSSGGGNYSSSSASSAFTGMSHSSSENYSSATTKSIDGDWRIRTPDLDVDNGWDVSSLTLHHDYSSSHGGGGRGLDIDNPGAESCHSVLSFSGEESLSSNSEDFGLDGDGDGYGIHGMDDGNGGGMHGGGGGRSSTSPSVLLDYQHIMLAGGGGDAWFE